MLAPANLSTRPYRIQIVHCPPAPARPYYLRWYSSQGNLEGWLFLGEADDKVGVEGAVSLAREDGTTEAISKPLTETVTVRAGNLSTAQHRGLVTILSAPQVYLQAPDGTRTPVYVVDNSAGSRSTSEGRHVLEIALLLPAANSLTN